MPIWSLKQVVDGAGGLLLDLWTFAAFATEQVLQFLDFLGLGLRAQSGWPAPA